MSDLFGTSVFGIQQFTSETQQSDLLGGLVFTGNKQSNETPTDIDWDELDLQLFDGTGSDTESDSASDTSDEAQSEAQTEGEWVKTYDSDGEVVIQYYTSGASGATANFIEEEIIDSEGNTQTILTITSVNSDALNQDGQLVLNFGGYDDMADETSESESEGSSDPTSGGATAAYAQLNLTGAAAPILLKNNHAFTDVRGAENHSNDLHAGRFGSMLKGGNVDDILHGRTNQRDVFVATYGNDRIKNYGKGDRIRMGAFFADIIGAATRIILKKIAAFVGLNDVDDESDIFATNTLTATQGVVIDADATSDGGSEAAPTVYYNFDSEGNIVLYANADGSGDNLTIEGIKDPAGEYGSMGNRALRFSNDQTGENISWTFEADTDSEGSESASDSSEGASDSSEGSETESEGASDSSEGSETESEGASDSSEGSETESEGASDSSEGSETESEGASDSSEGSETESEGASDSSEASSEAKSEGSIANIIDKSTSVDDVEKTFGLTTDHDTLSGNSAGNWWGKSDTDPIFSGSSTVAGASAADLDKPLEVWLSNVNVGAVQSFDVSKNSGVKKVHLNAGAQDITFNPAVGGNFVEVTVGATGSKNITLSNGGDAVLVDMQTGDGTVNILGGTGDDSVVVRDNASVTFDMSKGGADILFTFAAANARISLEGYNASTGAAIQVEEQGASVIADAIKDSLIGFGDGVVYIESGDDKSRVYLGENDNNGWMVNMKSPYKESDTVQAVGFTGIKGGTVDGSAYEDVIFIGNTDGTKSAGSSLYGGAGNDTFFGGGGDTIITGDGKDFVELQADSGRDGAVVNISGGRTTITGSNNTLGGFTGDTIAIDELDITTTKFTYAGDSLIIKDDTLGFHAVMTTVSSLEGGYTTQYIQNASTGITYSVAIGAQSSTMYVADDEDARAYAYIGNNSTVDFTNYFKDAIIDLGKDWSNVSYIDGNIAYFDGVNQLVGGEGKTVFKGSDAKETLIAGKGNTSLYGAGGLNVLGGYSGTDKEGSTTFFVIGGNDGAVHTINNFEYVGNNNFYYAANVTADQIETDINNNHFSNVAIVDDDLLIEVTSNSTGETEKALLKGAVDTVTGYSKDFAVNGLVAQVGKDVVDVDDIADYYLATGTNATVSVGSSITDEAFIWLDDPDRIGVQFEGDFNVIDAHSSTVRAELAGNTADNTIIAGSGNTSLWGGNGGNDLLIGGTGKDDFYYTTGEGNDTITGTTSGDNVNLFNLTLADITIDTITSSAVVFSFSDGGKLTVNDNNTGVNFKVGNATYQLNGNREFEQK